MNLENTTVQHKTILWILLGLMTLITLYPFFEIGITTGDDMLYYHLSFRKDLWPLAFQFAKDNGRFYFALVNPLYTFPYTFDNHVFTKTIQYTSLAISFFVFSAVIIKVFKSTAMGMLSLTLLLTTLSLSKWTSLIVCYPFCFCFSFTLILCSVLLLLKYLEIRKPVYLLSSAIVYLAGLLFYEVYLLYLLIVAMIILAHYAKEKRLNEITFPYKKTFKTLLPFIIVGGLYLIVYFTFYMLYPTNYDGNSLAPVISAKGVFSILKNYPESAFPLSVFYQNQSVFQYQSDLITGHKNDLFYILQNARVEWLVKAVIACTLLNIVLTRLPHLSVRKILLGILASLILIYLSHIFLTVTKKYNTDYPDLKGYIPTFFSFFGVVLLFTLLCQAGYRLMRRNMILKIMYTGTLTVYLFSLSIKTSYSNHYTARDMAQGKLTFDMIDDFCTSETFLNLPEGAIIYGEDLWENSSAQLDLFNQGFSWSSYIYNKKNKLIHITKDLTSFREQRAENPSAPLYIVKKRETHKAKEGFLLFAPLDSTLFTGKDSLPNAVNSATLFYYSPYKEFSLAFSMYNPGSTPNEVQIDSFHESVMGNYYAVNISNHDKNQPSTVVQLHAPAILLSSLLLSDMPMKDRPTVEIY